MPREDTGRSCSQMHAQKDRCCHCLFSPERVQLTDSLLRRTTDFVEEEARVTRCSTFTVRGILYSAPIATDRPPFEGAGALLGKKVA
jgi:hypothetical protein